MKPCENKEPCEKPIMTLFSSYACENKVIISKDTTMNPLQRISKSKLLKNKINDLGMGERTMIGGFETTN